ncbi:hypothetical protein PTKIN_Ptkin14bG0126500 [Pterospermum kingtungense]
MWSNSTGHVVMLDVSCFSFSCLAIHARGTISSSLLELRYLSILNLNGIIFNGRSVPEFIGSLRELTWLSLSRCQLNEPIPFQLGNLSKLVTLDLSQNQLTGSIPESLENMVALRELRLSWNLLVGEIPKSLWNICSLRLLDVHSNKLGGAVFGFLQGTSLCTTYSLELLLLTDNQLTGSVPDEIAKLSSLRELRVGNNHLNGSISQSI